MRRFAAIYDKLSEAKKYGFHSRSAMSSSRWLESTARRFPQWKDLLILLYLRFDIEKRREGCSSSMYDALLTLITSQPFLHPAIVSISVASLRIEVEVLRMTV
jgi:hypothetical protein